MLFFGTLLGLLDLFLVDLVWSVRNWLRVVGGLVQVPLISGTSPTIPLTTITAQAAPTGPAAA